MLCYIDLHLRSNRYHHFYLTRYAANVFPVAEFNYLLAVEVPLLFATDIYTGNDFI